MSITARSDRFWELVDPVARVKVLGDGFIFIEGPVWHPTGATCCSATCRAMFVAAGIKAVLSR